VRSATRLTILVALAVCAVAPNGQGQTARPLVIEFSPQSESFAAATEEYRGIWMAEGERIVTAMERATGLRFERGPIQALVYEGVSYSGYGSAPMRLRASYPRATKRATLVHELGHRLLENPKKTDDHPILFLFLYDVWVELWGKEFGDEQVAVESKRRGLYDYEAAWRKALSIPAAERAATFKSLR